MTALSPYSTSDAATARGWSMYGVAGLVDLVAVGAFGESVGAGDVRLNLGQFGFEVAVHGPRPERLPQVLGQVLDYFAVRDARVDGLDPVKDRVDLGVQVGHGHSFGVVAGRW